MTKGNKPSLSNRTVIVAVRFGSIGTRQKLDPRKHMKEGGKDADVLHLAKDLFDSGELKEVVALGTRVRHWLRRMSLGTSQLLKGGMYLLPSTMVPKVEEYLAEAFQDRKALVDKFLERYSDPGPDGVIARARKRLGVYFNEADYPDADAVARCFTASYEYVTIDTPDNLRSISEDLYQREMAKAEARLVEAEKEIKAALRQEVLELSAGFAEALAPGKDGKRKVFKESRVNRLREFLDTYSYRQILGDDALTAEVQKLRKVMDGWDSGVVREDDGVREQMRSRFDAIRAVADKLVEEAPLRTIQLED